MDKVKLTYKEIIEIKKIFEDLLESEYKYGTRDVLKYIHLFLYQTHDFIKNYENLYTNTQKEYFEIYKKRMTDFILDNKLEFDCNLIGSQDPDHIKATTDFIQKNPELHKTLVDIQVEFLAYNEKLSQDNLCELDKTLKVADLHGYINLKNKDILVLDKILI